MGGGGVEGGVVRDISLGTWISRKKAVRGSD